MGAESPSDLPIPRTLADINAVWLSTALRFWNPSSPQVLAVRSDMIGQGVRLAGLVARLFVDYAGQVAGLPHTLVAKLPIASAEAL